MGLGDEYSRDALFRRSDQEVHNSESECEECEDPLDPEDFDALNSDEIYSDVVRIQEFVYDGYHHVLNRYGVAEYSSLIHEPEKYWSNCDIRMDVARLWRSLHFKDKFDPQSFQTWLKHFVELY
jgi:hypothetical protein